MKEYTIIIEEVLSHRLTVLAKDREEAYELAHSYAGDTTSPQPKEIVSNETEAVSFETVRIIPDEDEDES